MGWGGGGLGGARGGDFGDGTRGSSTGMGSQTQNGGFGADSSGNDGGDSYDGPFSEDFGIGQDPYGAPPFGSVVEYAADTGSFVASPQDTIDFASGVTFGGDGIGRAELTLPEKIVDFFLGPIDFQRQVSVNRQGLPTVTGTNISVNPAGVLGMAIPVPGASILTGYLGEKVGIPSINLASYGEEGNPAGSLMGGIGSMYDSAYKSVADAIGPGTVTAPPETQGGEGNARNFQSTILPQLALAPTVAPPPVTAPPVAPAPVTPAPVTPPPVGPVVVPPPAAPINLPERFYTRDPFRPFVRQPVPNSPFGAGIGSLIG